MWLGEIFYTQGDWRVSMLKSLHELFHKLQVQHKTQ